MLGGACGGCCPSICGADGPLLELGLHANGSIGSALAWGHWGVPLALGALFGRHTSVPNFGLVLASTGPEGPCTFVSCQDSLGVRPGARDVRRAPYYYVLGYSGIYVGEQVQSQFPLLGLGSFYLVPPTQNKHQPLPLPVNFPSQIPEGA